MKVVVWDGEQKRVIGRADVPLTAGPVLEVPLFGAASTIIEKYTIGTMTVVRGSEPPSVERVIELATGQPPELLPGWSALAS